MERMGVEMDSRYPLIVEYDTTLAAQAPDVRVVVAYDFSSLDSPINAMLDRVHPKQIDVNGAIGLPVGQWGLAVDASDSYIGVIGGLRSDTWLLAHMYKGRGIPKDKVHLIDEMRGDLSIVLFGGALIGNNLTFYQRQMTILRNLAKSAKKNVYEAKSLFNPVPRSDISACLRVNEDGILEGTLFMRLSN